MKKKLPSLKKIKLLVCDVDGVLTDGTAYYTAEGLTMKKFSIRDGMGLVLLQRAGIHTAIVTSENSQIVERRATVLKIHDLMQGVIDKAQAVDVLLKKYSLHWSEVAFIGDDINDLPAFRKVGCAISPADGHSLNRKLAHYVTKNAGGHGCVREVCDMILAKQWKGNSIDELWLQGQH